MSAFGGVVVKPSHRQSVPSFENIAVQSSRFPARQVGSENTYAARTSVTDHRHHRGGGKRARKPAEYLSTVYLALEPGVENRRCNIG
jgi:hypothetical protein